MVTRRGINLIILVISGWVGAGISSQLNRAPPVTAKVERARSGKITDGKFSVVVWCGLVSIGLHSAVVLNRIEYAAVRSVAPRAIKIKKNEGDLISMCSRIKSFE